MQIITENISRATIPALNNLDIVYPTERVMMFDIETTGLSPDRSFIYMIGINIRKSDGWEVKLLFNDDGRSEPEIIKTFQDELLSHDILIEFNGDQFDINFVKRRMAHIKRVTGITIEDNFSTVRSVDLMKLIRPYKFALGLPNIKQKTIERFLGINREDQFNGGQLIDVYLDYLSSKDETAKHLVVQHNRDDMVGMMYLSDIFAVTSLSDGNFEVSGINTELKAERLYLNISLKLPFAMPRHIFASGNGISVNAEALSALVSIPIVEGTFRYYFENSKTSFEEHTGYFITSMNEEVPALPVYKTELKSKTNYIELSDNFLGNAEHIKEYAGRICRLILQNKFK